MGMLEQSLNEVKGLFKDKVGHNVDEDVVGKFVVTRGAPSMGMLEQSLNEVKGLYKDKIGHNVDEDGKRTWAWHDGSELTYSNWHRGEPNNDAKQKKDCGELGRFSTPTWNDVPCSHKQK